MRRPSLREKGFTLIEVMISTGLITILVGSMMALLSDYSMYFQEARQKSTLMTLRRSIIQNLNRREAWIVTYRDETRNSSFNCLLNNNATTCAGGKHKFTLYSRTYPPTEKTIVFSTLTPPSYLGEDSHYGLTAYGEYCNTFDSAADTGAAKRCPFRLDLTWELLTFGIPNADTDPAPGQYYPTGYMPAGYYIGTGAENYFGPGYFPGGTGGVSSYYWWAGTLGAQVRVRGEFTIHDSLKSKINKKSYDFSIIKEVP